MSPVIRLPLLISALFLVALGAGCTRSEPRADIVVLNGAEPETLDPAIITGQLEGRLAYALFDGLLSFDVNARPVPAVAEQWEISADKKHYTFHLRHNARWSDGSPVTARDFVYSWQRALAPETASEYASQLYYLENAEAFNRGALKDFSQVGVKATDDYTLDVQLENPTSYFLDLCAFTTLLPVQKACIEKWGDQWTKPGHLVSNGAFTLQDWRINDRVRLAKNPHYWNAAAVSTRTLDALPISSPTTALNFFYAGQADVILDKGLVPSSLIDALKTKPFYHAGPFLGTTFLRFNVTRKPFNDPRVRLAFSLAIDKRRIVEKVTRAGQPVASSLVPPGTAGYQPPPGLQRDPARARQLLAEAGYPGGKGFPLVHYLYREGPEPENTAIEIQSMLKEVLGVQIALQRQEWKAYLRTMGSIDYDLCASTWVGDYNDPNTFLNMFLTGDGNNRTGWGDPQYDQWIADAAREADPQKRFVIFQKAEHKLISEAAPICPIYFYVGIQFYNPEKIGGLQSNLLDEHPLKSLYLVQH
ncbi:MAG: peptide ABC transporter substrate-binding protein [Chthoniobacteraceae bacterium]